MKKLVNLLMVGSELTMGYTLDRHGQYLAIKLTELGYRIGQHLAVADDENAIVKALHYLSDADLIIVTGGLGPTVDDMTRSAVAKFIGLPLVESEDAKRKLTGRFRTISAEMTTNNLKQVFFPVGSDRLINHKGTADGFFIGHMTPQIAVLPGPPHEMHHVFEQQLKHYLSSEASFAKKEYSLYGLGESAVDQKMRAYLHSDAEINAGIYSEDGLIRLRFIGEDSHRVRRRLAQIDQVVNAELADYLYAEDSTSQLQDQLVSCLQARQQTVSCAESCSGGMIAQYITQVPGASKVFEQAVITYSNDAKRRLLDVPSTTLEQHGAVSAPTCQAMLYGLKQKFGADLNIAVTGIAGPSGGSAVKPVGLVYIGVSYRSVKRVVAHQFSGDRQRVRRRSTQRALKTALELLL